MTFPIHKKLITVFLLVMVVFGFCASPAKAAGGIAASFASEIIDGIIAPVLGAVLKVESTILAMTGKLVDITLQPPEGGFLQQPIVQTGWTITRDFANMFLIMILLAIALSYILFPTFQVKNALPKLLLVALLINFSLPVAGIFLDASSVFTMHFVNKTSEGSGNVSEVIANNMRIQDTTEFTPIENAQIQIDAIINFIFAIVFQAVVIFIFLAISIMLLIRQGYIYILLIMLPLALLAYIWPSTQGRFSQWQNKFFQWTFFAPISAFFIYLSMTTYNSILSRSAEDALKDLSIGGIYNLFYTYIIIFILLIGSLVAAQSMSITGANVSMKWLKGAGNAIKGAAWRGTKRGTARVMEKAGVPEKLGKAAEIAGRAGILTRPLTRALGRAEVGIKGAAAKRFEMSDAEKKAAEKMSNEALRGQMKAGGPKAHVYASILANRGNLSTDDAKKYIGDAEKYGNKEAIKNITRVAPKEAADRKIDEIDELEASGNIDKIQKLYGTRDVIKARDIAQQRAWGTVNAGFVKDIPPEMLEGQKGTDYMRGLMKYGNMTSEHIKAAAREGNWAFVDAYKRVPDVDKSQRMRDWETSDPAAKGIL